MNESVEQSKSKREILLELERTNKYVFHGSPRLLEELEPRQAQTFNSEKSQMIDDGEPAVVTSPFADVAIFRSVINRENIKTDYSSSFSHRNGILTFSANPKTIEQARGCKGYIYVFDKDDFEQHSPMEYRSRNIVKPAQVIQVTYDDLPQGIDIES